MRRPAWTTAAGVTAIVAGLWALGADHGRAVPTAKDDMLCPRYYRAGKGSPFRAEIDRFLSYSRQEIFNHPLQKGSGLPPRFRIPKIGTFGAGKGPGGDKQHHPAVDLHLGRRETDVRIYAAHGGQVTVFRNAPKYRHALAITTPVIADNGDVLGKIVTIYAHIDLDLDEADGLVLADTSVRKGQLVSRHLYSGTVGGPHLHFEIRYYRPGDDGDETFYGFRPPRTRDSDLTEASAGPWAHGYWNPDVGYGFADPRNHGLDLQ